MTDNAKPAAKSAGRSRSTQDDDAPQPTHTLILANGESVEIVNGGSVTHVDIGTPGDDNASKPVKVLFCNEI